MEKKTFNVGWVSRHEFDVGAYNSLKKYIQWVNGINEDISLNIINKNILFSYNSNEQVKQLKTFVLRDKIDFLWFVPPAQLTQGLLRQGQLIENNPVNQFFIINKPVYYESGDNIRKFEFDHLEHFII